MELSAIAVENGKLIAIGCAFAFKRLNEFGFTARALIVTENHFSQPASLIIADEAIDEDNPLEDLKQEIIEKGMHSNSVPLQ
ncbi:MAG: hypothetical protein U0798_03465 [Gemmataceae bacterium]